MLLEARGLSRIYRQGDSRVEALRGISLEVPRGDLLAVTGPSGCGKSTLLHILGLLDSEFEGELRFAGRPVRPLTARERARIRLAQVGFLFQQFHLMPSLSALDNVALPHWRLHGNRGRALERARALLASLGLTQRLGHLPGRLSGGEAQRVALARALVNDPVLVLADEPTAHLDEEAAGHVIGWLEHRSRAGQTVILASHDQAVVHRATRSVRLRYGELTRPPEQAAPGDTEGPHAVGL